ncbi:acyltransferase family protein [Coleofasciculus sp. E2-BRE-01]|uniref:acyltransferase family protein n=1 Tax=Coleofasciculus sp. E2-BRE-01 TaxID=3069524 RepID=UPI003300B223
MKYITQLDGIRAISIIFVLIGHWSEPPIKNLIPWGNIGVYTFFVISSYLITNILLEVKTVIPPGSAFLSFWGRRILRICPIYYLTLTVLLFCQHQPVSDYAAWHFTFLSNFLIMSPVGYQGTTDHLWALAVEGQFYLIWPLIIFFIRDKYLPYVMGSLLLISPLCRLALYLLGMGSVIKVFPLSSVDFLGMGAIVAFSHKNKQFMGVNVEQLLKRVFPWVATGFFFVELFRYWGYHNIIYNLFGTSCLVFGLGWLISTASRGMSGLPKRLLEFNGLRFIGRISYGLYLYHLFFAYYFLKWFPGLSLEKNMGHNVLAFMILFMATFGLATVSWLILEKPLLKYKKYFPLYKYNSPQITTK